MGKNQAPFTPFQNKKANHASAFWFSKLINAVHAQKYSDRSSDVRTKGSEMQMKYKTSRLTLQGNNGGPNTE